MGETSGQRGKRYQIVFSLLAVSLPFSAAPLAFAAEAAHGGGGAPLSQFVINFLVYVFILWVFLHKTIRKVWAERHEQVAKAVAEGRLAMQQAREQLAHAEQQLARLEDEVLAVRRSIKEETEAASAQVHREARHKTEQILDQARRTGEAERRLAEREVRAEIARTVVDTAAQHLQREITPDRDKAFRYAALGQLKGLLQ